MSRYAIRLMVFALLSVLLATTPDIRQAYAGGDPPASDPPPGSKKKNGGTSYREEPAFVNGYRVAYRPGSITACGRSSRATATRRSITSTAWLSSPALQARNIARWQQRSTNSRGPVWSTNTADDFQDALSPPDPVRGRFAFKPGVRPALFDAAAVQVGFDLKPCPAAEPRAIDLQVLHDPLHVVPRLG